jgi:hypothetical protein
MAGMVSRLAVVLIGGLVLASAASGTSVTSPDVAAMNLQATDVPGAKLVTERAVKEKGYVAANDRTYTFTSPNGSSRLILVEAETKLAATASVPTSDLTLIETAFRSQLGHKLFIATIAKAAKVKPAAVVVGKLRKAAGYDQGFLMPLSFPVHGRRVYGTIAYLRLDRVGAFIYEVGLRPVTAGATGKFMTALAGHIGTELAPIAVSPPTIAGTAAQGQTLTASPGAWTAPDAAFTYQWQRCDATGANCVAVPGATAQTYAVTAADAGATLVVVVTATNRFGAPSAPSVATAVVPAS